ncbi:MAG: glucokinase, partial [Pseudomonadota bacterium]
MLRRGSDIDPIPFPVLMADIGGTNARFAILQETHSPLREFATVQTRDYPDIMTAVSETVLDTTAILPRSLLIAIAAPLHSGATKLTNADWVIEPEALLETLNLDTLITFNDFEALSLSLPSLGPDQVVSLGGGAGDTRSPRVVLGPGTGLGVAALIYADGRYQPIAGEGGHMSFGPASERDEALWPHLERLHGRVTGETLLSGNGLARIYRALAAEAGRDGSACSTGAEVTDAAGRGDTLGAEAIDLFLTYLGRIAGDLALLFLARGGVYIAGGIAPRLADKFAGSRFREAFEDKAPHRAIVEDIPTYLVTEPKPAVAGLSSFAQLPGRFCVNLGQRRLDRS